ncbi:hypothetical protein TDB9533_04107 [Thalassocella blandensis]|nr:hypothetical protein TDB9533_04107 [Thalassocella blandensis]
MSSKQNFNLQLSTLKKCKLGMVVLASLYLTACGGDDDNGNNGNENENGGNAAPSIVLASSDITVEQGADITLDASGSSDPEGESLTFSWSGESGTITDAQASTTTVTGLTVGTYTFTVSVSDGEVSSTSDVSVEVTGPAVKTVTKLDTGTMQEPVSVYFDLDNDEELMLTEEEAETNSDWDVAFKRTEVYLNQYAETPVTLYFSGNTDDFYNESGSAVVERFINATGETELAAFESYDGIVPEGAQFNGDSEKSAIEGFYNYDFATHTVSANDTAFYIVSSDSTYAKIRVTNIVQDGFGMASLTFGVSLQTAEESVFSAEQSLLVDAQGCTENLYVNLDGMAVADAESAWDVVIPCENALGGFQIDLAGDATALIGNDAAASEDGVDPELAPYLSWKANTYEIRAIKEYGDSRSNYGWAEYGINGGHAMWPNYATYIIKTAEAQYKFQITNYYDVDDSSSGSFTIRYQKVLGE